MHGKQSILIISEEDVEIFRSAINNNHNRIEGIKIDNIAGSIDNIIIGNALSNIVCHLFHTPKAGFTYAAISEDFCLYGKKFILSTFPPDIQQKNA